ncbi:MAG TPA: hypothetical protein VF250_00095, partial [Conexibacter sp.]
MRRHPCRTLTAALACAALAAPVAHAEQANAAATPPETLGAALAGLPGADLDGDGTPDALPVDALALPQGLIDRLDALLHQLEAGGQPTGAALAPVSDLLDSAAATDGLPDTVSGALSGLADSLRGTSGALDPLTAEQARFALDTIASTPGLSAGERTTIQRIGTFVAPAGSGGATTTAGTRRATKRDRAVVKRIRVNRARTRVGIRIACPRSAPVTCATTVTAKLAGRKAANGKRVRIAPGRSKVVRLRMLRAARSASADHGGRLRVRVVTAFGTQRFTATKAAKLEPRHH